MCQGDAHSAVPMTTVGTRLRTGRDKTSHVVISQAVLLLKKTLLCILLGKNKNHVLILEGQALCWLSPPYWSSPSLTTDVPRWLPGSLQGQEPTVWLLTKSHEPLFLRWVHWYPLRKEHVGDGGKQRGEDGADTQNLLHKEGSKAALCPSASV